MSEQLRRKRSSATAVDVVFDDDTSYVRFVATASVDLLAAAEGCSSRADVATKLSMKPPNLSTQLNRPEGPTTDFLEKLQRYYLATGNPLHNGVPWLTSLARELRLLGRSGEPYVDTIRVPGGWLYNLSKNRLRNSTEAFVCGHALLDFIQDARAAGKTGRDLEELLRKFRLEKGCNDVVRSLLEVACGPPHTGFRAVQLLAGVGLLALDDVEEYIFMSPAGFRTTRVLGRILSDYRKEDDPGKQLLNRVKQLLERIADEDPPDPYPARSLFVEALRYAPNTAGWEWVTPALLKRAESEDRPVRERVYAAFVLFERKQDPQAKDLQSLFSVSANEGLAYAAAFLSMLFRSRAMNRKATWPTATAEFGIVADALEVIDDELEIPASVRPGLKDLLRGALLTIDGTTRRRACETIQASGLGKYAVKGIEAVLEDERTPEWLAEHAAFITGYLETGDRDGAPAATRVLSSVADSDRSTATRHAALWGIGDVVGSVEEPPDPIGTANLLRRTIGGKPDAHIRRATAYAAAMLARRSEISVCPPYTCISDVLAQLAKDGDDLTASLARWGQGIEVSRSNNEGYLASSVESGLPHMTSQRPRKVSRQAPRRIEG